MKYLFALLCLALLAVPADAGVFGVRRAVVVRRAVFVQPVHVQRVAFVQPVVQQRVVFVNDFTPNLNTFGYGGFNTFGGYGASFNSFGYGGGFNTFVAPPRVFFNGFGTRVVIR